LGGLALAWQPLAGPTLWHGPTWIVVFAAAGAAGTAFCPLPGDATRFFGLRQAWQREQTPPPESLHLGGPYRYVRHPLMACMLLFLWAHPVMPPALVLLSGGMTLYILLGIWLEERDLTRRFGMAYTDYRRRVPALVPWRGRG